MALGSIAAAVWLLNACVVLSLTVEGLAGQVHLGLSGILWFAAAHALFFALAVGVDRLATPAREPVS